MNYLLVSLVDVSLCETENALWNSLRYRFSQNCIVYTAKSVDELHMLARLKYNSLIEMNINPQINLLSLPENVSEGYALSIRQESEALTTAINSVCYGAWAITGLNGFCTANSIEELIDVLQSDILVYAMAIWCGAQDKAIYTGRKEYVRRFFSHFDGRVERPALPCKVISSFLDSHYNQRENRRADMAKNLGDFLMKVNDRVW